MNAVTTTTILLRCVLLWGLLLSWSFVVVVDAATKKKKRPTVNMKNIQIGNDLRYLCGKRENALTSKMDEKRLKWLVVASGEGSLLLPNSPQHAAACWVLYKDKMSKKRSNQDMYTQRYAVAVLHFATTKSNTTAWDWPMAADDPKAITNNGNWMNPTMNECQWYGVVCDVFSGKIKEFNLGFMKLDGLVPREVSLLSNLVDIDFHGNDFQGVIPHKIMDSLSNLQYLRFHMNGFFGNIHKEISGLYNLKELHLFGNYIAGKIPKELGTDLTQLEVIDLYANQLTGRIPTELGLLRKLTYLDLHDNNLIGSVPAEICKLVQKKQLKDLIVDCYGSNPEVSCSCCTICCRGLPDFVCVDQKTGRQVMLGR